MSHDNELTCITSNTTYNDQVLPRPIIEVRDKSIEILLALTGDMFDGADDLFFELAESAYSNVDQGMYFESMREVRIKRSGFENRFQQELLVNFRTFMANAPVSQPNHQQAQDDGDSLSLVEDDDLDESVAVTNMVKKARTTYPKELLHLNLRMEALLHKVSVTEENNPLDPKQICHAFSQSLPVFDLTNKAKLIVLKLFDRFVISHLDKVLPKANEIFINAGVLPKLRASVKRSDASIHIKPGDSLKNALNGEEVEDTAIVEGDVFGQLQKLLAETRVNAPEAEQYKNVTSGPGVVVSSNELLTMLSHLDSQTEFLDDVNDDDLTGAVRLDIRGALSKLLTSSSEDDDNKILAQTEEDTINLVSKLFDFILEDDNLPVQMQAFLGRLQIPILKVAIKDKDFFDDINHPARKLLNELARAGIGWNEGDVGSRDSLYKKIHDIVQRIRSEFQDDIGIFVSLHQEFLEFMERENKRVSLVEQRTQDTELGQARFRLARSIVEDSLVYRLKGKRVPETIVKLLKDGWSNVLFLHCIKEGTESESWTSSLQTVDQLLWVVHPSSRNMNGWEDQVTEVKRQLEQGLTKVSYNPFDMDQKFQDLDNIIIALRETGDLPVSIPLVEPHPQDMTDKQTLALSVKDPSSEGDSALDKQFVKESAELSENMKVLDNIAEGDWLEFSYADGTRRRCKLMTIIPDTDTMMFVSRRGIKMFEKSKKMLAHEIRNGKARVLNKAPIFDRALGSIFHGIARFNQERQTV